GDLPGCHRYPAKPGDAAAYGGGNHFYALDPDHRLVWDEFSGYVGYPLEIRLWGHMPAMCGHCPVAAVAVQKEALPITPREACLDRHNARLYNKNISVAYP